MVNYLIWFYVVFNHIEKWWSSSVGKDWIRSYYYGKSKMVQATNQNNCTYINILLHSIYSMYASVLRYAYAYDGDSSWRSDLWGNCPYARPRLEVVTSLTAVPKVTLAKWCYRIWKHKPFTVFLLATCGYWWCFQWLESYHQVP